MGSSFPSFASFASLLFVAFVVLIKKKDASIQSLGVDASCPSKEKRCCLCF